MDYFDPRKVCPECGEEVGHDYCKGCSQTDVKPHIHRRCKCGHEWIELPRFATTIEEKSEPDPFIDVSKLPAELLDGLKEDFVLVGNQYLPKDLVRRLQKEQRDVK